MFTISNWKILQNLIGFQWYDYGYEGIDLAGQANRHGWASLWQWSKKFCTVSLTWDKILVMKKYHEEIDRGMLHLWRGDPVGSQSGQAPWKGRRSRDHESGERGGKYATQIWWEENRESVILSNFN